MVLTKVTACIPMARMRFFIVPRGRTASYKIKIDRGVQVTKKITTKDASIMTTWSKQKQQGWLTRGIITHIRENVIMTLGKNNVHIQHVLTVDLEHMCLSISITTDNMYWSWWAFIVNITKFNGNLVRIANMCSVSRSAILAEKML